MILKKERHLHEAFSVDIFYLTILEIRKNEKYRKNYVSTITKFLFARVRCAKPFIFIIGVLNYRNCGTNYGLTNSYIFKMLILKCNS